MQVGRLRDEPTIKNDQKWSDLATSSREINHLCISVPRHLPHRGCGVAGSRIGRSLARPLKFHVSTAPTTDDDAGCRPSWSAQQRHRRSSHPRHLCAPADRPQGRVSNQPRFCEHALPGMCSRVLLLESCSCAPERFDWE